MVRWSVRARHRCTSVGPMGFARIEKIFKPKVAPKRKSNQSGANGKWMRAKSGAHGPRDFWANGQWAVNLNGPLILTAIKVNAVNHRPTAINLNGPLTMGCATMRRAIGGRRVMAHPKFPSNFMDNGNSPIFRKFDPFRKPENFTQLNSCQQPFLVTQVDWQKIFH